MTCPRCNGLLVKDTYIATKWANFDDLRFMRCANCGNAVDQVIQQHRDHPELAMKRQVKYGH